MLPGTNMPGLSSAAISDSDRMTRSAASPFLTRSRSEPAVLKMRSSLVAAGALELAAERLHHRLHGAGAQDFDGGHAFLPFAPLIARARRGNPALYRDFVSNWIPAVTLGQLDARTSTMQLQTGARHRPYSLAAPGRPSLSFPPPRKRTEGARDAKGPGALKFTQVAQTKMLGPAGLDASRHRGLSKSGSAASPPNPRRPARGVCEVCSALAPGGLTFSGNPAFPYGLSGRLSTALGPGRTRRPVTGRRCPPSRGPVARGWRAGTTRLGPPGG